MASKQYLSATDYDIFIKNLDKFANHPDLKKAVVVTTSSRGGKLPYAFSGGFARVYKIKVEKKFLALRCWTKDPGKIQQRAKYINDFVSQKKLLYFVHFEYAENAGYYKFPFSVSWMEWIEGLTLSDFLDSNINNKQKIEEVAADFLNMANLLHQHKVAHGDLQSENIKICESNGNLSIKLIDYDSLYIPSMPDDVLDALPGVSSFQHPKRPPFMKEKADYFSELVIYLSLLVYAEYPMFWKGSKGQDKRLLFDAQDFEQPDSSQKFAQLLKLPSQKINLLASELKNYCKSSPKNLKPLDSIVLSDFQKTTASVATPGDLTFLKLRIMLSLS